MGETHRVRRPTADRELDALAVCTAAIMGLPTDEAARVLKYLNDRFAEQIRDAAENS